ncbi:hypothetical protein HPB48_022044 [Haemaphysalis longicornis]|uniref:PiggyBac transposable element-derived protein domain-containing protein n=1 Tax=Haemaphysalis longicornis TaxID=44386 RepID=A0A9J6GUU4_HAELO|nr:hypothetical protein HPB48_022044 [Haemaphysalis longicornis]
MNRVDKFDQNRNAYPADRWSKRWWGRIFYFILDAAVVNAFVQANPMEEVTYLDFRLKLGHQPITERSFHEPRVTITALKTKEGKKSGSTMTVVLDEHRFAGRPHHPNLTATRPRCRWCSTIKK